MKTNEQNDRQKELEKFEKELNRKILQTMFPTLSSMPLPWIFLSIVVILFSLFSCIII